MSDVEIKADDVIANLLNKNAMLTLQVAQLEVALEALQAQSQEQGEHDNN